MNCRQTRSLLHAHGDGELDTAYELQVDEHLTDCPQCFGLARNLANLRDALQNDALRYSAPAGLRQSIRAAIVQSAQSEHNATAIPKWSWNWTWSAAAALLVTTIFALQFRPLLSDERLLAELTESHVRSLMVDHLTDVSSTDRRTVNPWFTGKLDFTPPVEDLKSVGFPLLGGRLDYVDDRAVAALVYASQKHTINLFIWPAESSVFRSPHAIERNDYRIVRWSDGGMNLVAVSDLGEAKLREFAASFCHSARRSFTP
jgi:anti-sigma factor RsiW